MEVLLWMSLCKKTLLNIIWDEKGLCKANAPHLISFERSWGSFNQPLDPAILSVGWVLLWIRTLCSSLWVLQCVGSKSSSCWTCLSPDFWRSKTRWETKKNKLNWHRQTLSPQLFRFLSVCFSKWVWVLSYLQIVSTCHIKTVLLVTIDVQQTERVWKHFFGVVCETLHVMIDLSEVFALEGKEAVW